MTPYNEAPDYYSELCSRCRWGEWRGGCLNPAAAPDGSDGERALQTGSCPVFAAGTPQRDPNPGTLCVLVPVSDLSDWSRGRQKEPPPGTYQRRTPRELRRIPPADGVEHPWWAILDPDRPVRGQIEHLAGAITGPYLSRAEAEEELAAHGYRYGPRAQVWCLSGHASPSWLALCEEPRRPNL
jgi:hypothetical protein